MAADAGFASVNGDIRLSAGNDVGDQIALGVIVAVRIAGRRAATKGVGTMDDFASIAMWAVPAGVLGARAYHVLTDIDSYSGRWMDTLRIWEGGLGIWGGVVVGVVVGVWRAKVRGLDPGWILTCAAPAIPVAQAIGRWGNWFNQELFGRPTELPWALSVSDAVAREAGFAAGTTFHPTFLYESIACLVLAWALVRVERRVEPAKGQLIVWYAAGYSFLRFFVESLRVDETTTIAGLRLNQLVAIAVFTAAVMYLVSPARRSSGETPASTVDDHE